MCQINTHRNPAPFTRKNECIRSRRRPRHRNRWMRFLIRLHVDAHNVRTVLRNLKLPEIAFVVSRFRVGPNLEYRFNPFAGRLPSVPIRQEHLGIARCGTRADPPMKASVRLMIQLRDAMRHNRRVVYRHTRNPRAEDDVLCHCRCFRNKEIRRRNILPRKRKMLTNISLFITQLVQDNHLLNIVIERLGGVATGWMQRHCKKTEFHFLIFPCGAVTAIWTLTIFALESPAPLLQAARSCLSFQNESFNFSSRDMFLNLTKSVVSVIVCVG